MNLRQNVFRGSNYKWYLNHVQPRVHVNIHIHTRTQSIDLSMSIVSDLICLFFWLNEIDYERQSMIAFASSGLC